MEEYAIGCLIDTYFGKFTLWVLYIDNGICKVNKNFVYILSKMCGCINGY